MTKEKIAVIIPVYNVEQYLDRCVNSVVRQTYEELEIILVDDGSTDNSGEMCDRFAEQDKRIQVIHKRNGGLSDARNVGLLYANAEMVTFVDSDDYLVNDAVECMYRAKQEKNAQIGCCLLMRDDGRNQLFNDNKKGGMNPKFITYTRTDALRKMLKQSEITCSAWAKLYDKELFSDIRYPIGKLYEDAGTTYKLFAKAERVALCRKVGYCYYVRRGSIQNSAFNPKKFVELRFAMEQKEYLDRFFPELQDATTDRLISVCFHILFSMQKDAKKFKEEHDQLVAIIKEKRRKMIIGKNTSKKVRYGCLLSYLGFGFEERLFEILNIRGKLIE